MKPYFYTRKPETASGFKTAVAWFGGREMIASLKGIVMYAIYGETMDPRSWMKGNIFPDVGQTLVEKRTAEIRHEAERKAGADETSLQSSDQYTTSVAKDEVKADDRLRKQVSNAIEDEWCRRINDYWNWKSQHFSFWDRFCENQGFRDLPSAVGAKTDFWFDYLADTGDGQMAVYSVGLMAMSDMWLDEESNVRFYPNATAGENPDFNRHTLLPRGYFLFVGGDTAYHTASFPTLVERFQLPFRWAFTDVRRYLFENFSPTSEFTSGKWTWKKKEKPIVDPETGKLSEDWDGTLSKELANGSYWDTEPPRPLFGIPANHDYYDNIDGFNRLFRRSPFTDVFENQIYDGAKGNSYLRIPTFSREQQASYVAIHLPYDWWMFGIDSENEKLDFRQKIFFQEIVESKPTKLILATPEPTTVFGRKSKADDKTAVYFESLLEAFRLDHPFLNDGKFVQIENDPQSGKATGSPYSGRFCRLDLSGDVHHYARYWGPNTRDFKPPLFASENYASVVAGGGGAFFDSTSTMIGTTTYKPEQPTRDGEVAGENKVPGEIPPQMVFPSAEDSIAAHSEPLFDIRNISRGGYIHFAGAATSSLIFFLLTGFSSFSGLLCGYTECSSGDFFSRLRDKLAPLFYSDVIFPVGMLVLVFALLIASTVIVHILVKGLKRRMGDNKLIKDWDGRIAQLLVFSTPFFVTIAIYVALLVLGSPYLVNFRDPLTSNLMMILHVSGAGLIVWLSAEYTNWLAIRAKIMRDRESPPLLKKLEDPNFVDLHWYLRPIGWVARNYSYRYFFANALGLLAVFAVFFGIGKFGGNEFADVAADALLIATVGAVLIGYFYLAVSTGAAYLRGRGKALFAGFGIIHAAIQIASAIILFYVADWRVAIGLFVLTVIMNGVSIGPFLDAVISDNKMLNGLRRLRVGAWVMRNAGCWGTLSVWVLFGLVLMVVPFFSSSIVESPKSLNRYTAEIGQKAAAAVQSFISGHSENPIIGLAAGINKKVRAEDLSTFIYYLLAFAVLGYLGARMSRIWFGWYLAVSLLFNGHNNEAGGMARIEGYKHLLRIHVQEDKLTVYVIGFEKAVPSMSELEMKLVDKFELQYK